MTPEIVYIQPIFCPSRKLTDVNKNSLNSFYEYLKENPYNLNMVFGGWAYSDQFWNEVIEIIEKIRSLNLGNVSIKRFSRNYGKSYVVNKLSFKYLKKYYKTKYMLTFDSDIKFDLTQKFLFDRLILASKKLEGETNSTFGSICLNLNEHNHNNTSNKNMNFKYKFNEDVDEELLWDSEYLGGYNGGALFINTDVWQDLEGYKNYNQTYCPEDALWHLSLNALKYSFCIMKNLYVTHSHNVDEEYAQWKFDTMNFKLNIMDKFDRKQFECGIKDSEKFWRKKNEQD